MSDEGVLAHGPDEVRTVVIGDLSKANKLTNWCPTSKPTKIPIFVSLLFVFSLSSGLTQVNTKPVPLDDPNELKPRNVKIEMVSYKGRRSLGVSDAAPEAMDGERLVILNHTDFQDGVIEVDLTGEPGAGAGEGARGFVGI